QVIFDINGNTSSKRHVRHLDSFHFSTTKVDPYRYRMDFPRAGICVIINNINFHPFLRMNNLNGCDYDAAHVGNTFEKLGYKVYMFRDITTGQMKQALKSASLEDHSNSASFICVILSHGEKDVVYGTDGSVTLDALTKYFKGWACQSLLGKPKLFFINACRGDKSDKGADMVDSADSPITYRIPLEADFLYAYSTSPGYLAWMRPTGSFFIKAVCEVIEKHGNLELMQIMTRVNGIVAQCDMPTKEGRYIEMYKQMPSVTSMLTKEFYFPTWFKRLTL
uniref:Caspase-3 n=1 Tax=Periophthalmus magnuspinnatus TaxID=409849 RepID=A0A3B3ZG88_9GOBI